MNANYIYDIFEVTEEKNAHDLTVGLAMLEKGKPLPDGTTHKEIREFVGRHYDALVAAYRTRDRAAFADVVAGCVAEEQE